MPSEARQKKIMEKLDRAQKCSILGPQNLGSGGARAPGAPPGPAPGGKKDPRKDINILVVTDHFTHYAQAYVTMSQTTATVAKVLFERFFTQYGWPAKLLTDQGPQFEGRLFQQLMHEAQIRKIRTTPYHPEGNAQCERFNRTLLGMLETMPIESKKEWQEWVLAMTHAYNCTISKTTSFAPYFLMFGREPKIPIDRELNLPGRREEGGAQTYVDRLKQKLEWAFTKAQENIQRDMRARKKYHDKALRCHEVEVGDLVMLRDKKLGTNYKWRINGMITCMRLSLREKIVWFLQFSN